MSDGSVGTVSASVRGASPGARACRPPGSPTPTPLGVRKLSLAERLTAAEERLAQLEVQRDAALAEVAALREWALAPPTPKRLLTAYTLWLLCPFWPAYALYLGRDLHCWLYSVTMGGGLGVGWLVDGVCLPWYVADYNEPLGYLATARRRSSTLLAPRTLLLPFRLLIIYTISMCFGGVGILLLGSSAVSAALGPDTALLARSCAGLLAATAGAVLASRAAVSVRSRCRPFPALGIGAVLAALALSSEALKPEDALPSALAVSCLGIVAGCSHTLCFDASRSPSRGAPARLLPRLMIQGGGMLGAAGMAAAAFHLSASEMLQVDDFRQACRDVYTHLTTYPLSTLWEELMEAMRDPATDAAKLLGVEKTATHAEVRAAHRRLARQHHPDKLNGGSDETRQASEQMMQRLNGAKDVLLGRDGVDQAEAEGWGTGDGGRVGEWGEDRGAGWG